LVVDLGVLHVGVESRRMVSQLLAGWHRTCGPATNCII
jgi:hypothetical protein